MEPKQDAQDIIAGDLFRRMPNLRGTRKCACGKTISANKDMCFACQSKPVLKGMVIPPDEMARINVEHGGLQPPVTFDLPSEEPKSE